MSTEDDKQLLNILTNHIGDFEDFKQAVNDYHKKGYQAMEKVDALYVGQIQAAKYLANLEALPQIAEKFQSIKAELLPAAIAQSHVPVQTMNQALESQAKTYLFVIKCLLWMIAALFGAFVTIKIWYPSFFN